MVGMEEMDVVGKTGCAASIGPGGHSWLSLCMVDVFKITDHFPN